MKGATLHDLREDELALIDTMEIVSEGTDREEIEAKIQELGAAIRHKVDGTVRVRDYFESQIAMAKAEISRLEATIGRVGKMLNDLDFYVLSELETAEEHRLKGNLYTLCQGKCPPSVNITDSTKLPEKFMRTIPASSVPDKDAIKRAIQAKEDVPGAELFQRVRLRVL